MTIREIRWGRVLLGGLFSELTIFAIYIPLNSASPQAAYYSVPVLVLATAFVFGRWVAGPVLRGFVPHGALTAVAASVIYLALNVALGTIALVPWLFHISNVARVAGGAAGGALAGRRARTATAPIAV
jgi:hypothetical protein